MQRLPGWRVAFLERAGGCRRQECRGDCQIASVTAILVSAILITGHYLPATMSIRMTTRASWFQLTFLRRGDDLAFLLLRLLTGAFLVHGVWDNIASAQRMDEFVGFLRASKFAWPELMAPLSVWAQFLCGIGFLLGALTRWAGLICAFNFIVACAMVHWQQDFRGWWPAAVLVVIGLLLATHGPGRYSIDEQRRARRQH